MFGWLTSNKSREALMSALVDTLVSTNPGRITKVGPLRFDEGFGFRMDLSAQDKILIMYAFLAKEYFCQGIDGVRVDRKRFEDIAEIVKTKVAEGLRPKPIERNAYVDLAYYLRNRLRPGYRIDGPLHDEQSDFFRVVWAPNPNSAQEVAIFGNSRNKRAYFFKMFDQNMIVTETKDGAKQFLFAEFNLRGIAS